MGPLQNTSGRCHVVHKNVIVLNFFLKIFENFNLFPLPSPPSSSYRTISEAVKLCQPRVPAADIYQDYLLLSGIKTCVIRMCEFHFQTFMSKVVRSWLYMNE